MSFKSTSSVKLRYHNICLNDRWAAECIFPETRKGGFFLESGCAGDKSESSTYVLEAELGWKGACVEPDSDLYDHARELRQTVLQYALGNDTGEIDLFERRNLKHSALPGTFERSGFTAGRHPNVNTEGFRAISKVPMKTLAQVLREVQAPLIVHYVALNVKGAECETLQGFFADEHREFTVLTFSIAEGNSCSALLEAHDYVIVANPWGAACPWETYFVHRSALKRANSCLARF